MSGSTDEPAWKQRAVERSIRPAKLRAEQRVERFLDAARSIIAEKSSTDFTVQEVVDRSRQSLRSFYLQFDGKHELLLALFEDALTRSAARIREASARETDPLDRLRVAVEMLFEECLPNPSSQRPLFTDFAPALLVTHPTEVKVAHSALLAVFVDLMEDLARSGRMREGVHPRRISAMTMQTVMFVAQSSATPADSSARPFTAHEVWALCSRGFASAPPPRMRETS